MSAAVELIPVGEPGEGPYGIAVTDDGAVWFTLVHGAAVGRRDPDGTLTGSTWARVRSPRSSLPRTAPTCG
ncbi:hypothetical protein ACFQ9V_12420 [Leifsonia sp. NPDC056665]|uniref:hypothetical protein n=1 Tax=Leifsonia sp. NPDC056665 TaxID=3345901 RepID=UPI00368B5981